MSTCPCCGAKVDGVPIEALPAISLAPYERGVLDALVKAYPREMTCEQIANRIYAGRRDGGPLTAQNNVGVYLYRLRKKLAPYGWNAGSIGGDGIRLHKTGVSQ